MQTAFYVIAAVLFALGMLTETTDFASPDDTLAFICFGSSSFPSPTSHSHEHACLQPGRLAERGPQRLPAAGDQGPQGRGQVTRNFNLREFSRTTGATCPAKSHDAIRRLCLAYLEPMRAKFGACTVLSGYRHRAYNRAIGGAMFSQHIYDVTPETVAADLRFAEGRAEAVGRVREAAAGEVQEGRRSRDVHRLRLRPRGQPHV